MIGDVFHNLRCALDHLVYAVAFCESRPATPLYDRSLAFPITNCRREFSEAVKRRQLGNISDPVCAVFESFQPYNRPHPTLPPLLSILRNFNNTDKHRLWRLAYGAVQQGELGFEGTYPPDGRVWTAISSMGEVKDGTEVFAMACDRPTPNMDWNKITVQIIIALWHEKREPSGPEYTARTEIFSLFDVLSDEVRAIINSFTK